MSLAIYVLLALAVSTGGGLLVGRRSAVYVTLAGFTVLGLAKAWGDVYVFEVRPGTHPHLILLVFLNLVLALVCATAAAVGVRVRGTRLR